MSTTLTFTFDTLQYSKRLKDAGMEPKVAEAEAQILSETLSAALGSAALVTKQDLENAVNQVKIEVSNERAKIIQWVAALLIAQAGAIVALTKLIP
ncbi:MAG: hypothetical protein LBE62_10650 [Azonexus sp.]|jgi:hypothetical protein|nr:hypothetical protein [Azonexus sp.]